MTPADFDRLQAMMASRAGFALPHDRMQLAEHRLGPVARREGYHNVEALLAHIWSRPPGGLWWEVLETLLNTETWFRRDAGAIDLCASGLLPALGKARAGRPVRIWCAGASSGQEAYSIAMAALEAGIPVSILSTDLSRRMLAKGREGIYSGFEIQRGLSAHAMLRWFTPIDDQWQTRPELRAVIRFERANLLEPLSADLVRDGPFDLVFCRHVLCDMMPDRTATTVDLIGANLAESGLLFLGQGERPPGPGFVQVAGHNGVFVRSPARSRHAA